jgi:hypothetical protein
VRWEANYIFRKIKLYIMNISVARLTSSWDGGRLRVGFLIGGKGGLRSGSLDVPD